MSSNGEQQQMSRLNIELFKKVRNKIKTTPNAYDQGTFGRRSKAAPCGTAACIAGWACVLSGQMDTETLYATSALDPLEVQRKAAEVLRLSEEEADILFVGSPEGESYDPEEEWDNEYNVEGWPAPYGQDWYDARRRDKLEARAPRIAVAYIDHIIKTGKVLT